MIQKMSAWDPPLVEYQKHRGVVLTEPGRQAAIEVIRHHRLLELFLHQSLGFPWEEVHTEADRLEHFISEELEERISVALGNPGFDPHGAPIPTRNLTLPEEAGSLLVDLRPGQTALVRSVDDGDPAMLKYLAEIGLLPRRRLQVTAYSPFDDNLHIQIEGKDETVVLGPGVTRNVIVELA
jgi:DtxR family Mn-dependent transcriptional regulator